MIGAIHVHSDYSHDGHDPLVALRDFALERGIGFLGLTDHAEDFDAEVFARFLGECRSRSDDAVRLIPGLEFRFEGHPGLHLLALGLTEWIEPRTPEEFVRLTRGRAGFTIAAHPLLFRYRLPAAVAHGIDAIEIWNAAYNTRYLPDPRAIRLLHEVRRQRPEVVGTAGLDQNDAVNDRQTRVLLHRPGGDPLAELRAGRFTNLGRTMRVGAAADWGPVRLGMLQGARAVFDRVERMQERVAKAIKRGRARA